MSNVEPDRIIEPLAAEALLFQAVSALFSRPGSEKYALLLDPDFKDQAIAAAIFLDGHAEGTKELGSSIETTFGYALHSEEALSREYSLIFGHTLSNELSPYEMEFLQNDEIFYRTQRLADLQGFYAAFGFEVNSLERADHISVESEFIALLLTKEAYALANDLGDEAIEVCHNARLKFLREHYKEWVLKLAVNLRGMHNQPFYSAVGRYTEVFLNYAGAALKVM